MENADMFSNATAQLTFHDFLDRMRHPSAADLVRSIKHFIGAFLGNPRDPEKDSQSVQEFLSNTEEAFKAHPLWAGATEEEFESSGEGLEKYLMTKLFTRAFEPLPEDAKQDQYLSEKISILQQFIQPEHLDISKSYQDETSLLLAQKELQKMNTFKAPRGKLVCILNCCRVINSLLLNVSMAANDNPPGADDFLPVLIYVVIKANPPQLHSNLLYIQRYRHHSRLVSEASYFYTNLISAESFITNLDSKSLTMDPVEFDQKMEDGHRQMESMNAAAAAAASASAAVGNEKANLAEKKNQPKHGGRGVSPVDNDHVSSSNLGRHVDIRGSSDEFQNQQSVKNVSVEKLEEEAFAQVLDADKTGQLAKDYPFLYASAGDLRVMDVESLLYEYKELVLRYVALRTAVEGSASIEKLPDTISADSNQELGVDNQRGGANKIDSLGQVLVRSKERTELLSPITSNLASKAGLVSELEESAIVGSTYSLGEESIEKHVVNDTNRPTEDTDETTHETVRTDETTHETARTDQPTEDVQKATQETASELESGTCEPTETNSITDGQSSTDSQPSSVVDNVKL